MPLIIPSNSQSATGYTIDQSIRFNKDDTPYMTRTPSGAGNTKKWTLSWWEKRGRNVNVTNGNEYTFHTSTSGANNASYIYNYNNHPYYWEAGNTYIATMQLRDPSAWYNNVVVYDSANSVALERIKLFINGTRITDFSTYGGITLNQDSYWNSATAHYISNTSSSSCIDGYLAEIVFIDGQALDPSSFSETNDSGIWIPKDPSGLTFGSNGFYLKGADSSALGTDSSGNGNNFTTSGLASHDQVSDSPSNNFCTGLPIGVGNATGVTFSDGNLTGKTSGTAGNWVGSISLSSGKWYFEVNNHANGSGNGYGVGETPEGSYHHFALGSGGNQINDYSVYKGGNSSGDIVGFKLDFDAGTLSHTLDGTSYSSTGSLTSNMAYAVYSRLGSSSGHVVFNFGQDSTFGGLETAGSNSDSNGIGDFYYNVPSGFSAICTKNLGS